MTRDDVRKLIGGYATGTLTEAEKKLLFEAALDDQDLFDELSREQALKEALEEPGAKQRLIASLAPRAPFAWRRRPLVWSAASATVAAALVMAWILRPASAPVEMAKVEPRPVAGSAIAVQPAAPTIVAPPSGKPATPKPEAKKTPRAVENRNGPVDQFAGNPRAAEPLAAPPAQPPSPVNGRTPQEMLQVQAQPGQVQPTPFVDSGQRNQIAPGGAIGGRLAPASPPAVAEARALLARPALFAFDYSLGPDELVLKFAADGYFSIHFSPGLDTIVDSHVAAGSERREHIPNNATEATIVFSAHPQSTSGGVSVIRETKTGTVDDPRAQRIELLLRFYP